MALIHWSRSGDMFSEFSKVQRDVNRLFGELDGWFGSRSGGVASGTVYPPVNTYSDGESFIVRAELPGIDPQSLNIEVAGDTLTIGGERKAPELPEGASYHRRERDFGEFRRSLKLPERVESQKVVAAYQDGVLEVRLPQAEESKARRIAVEAA